MKWDMISESDENCANCHRPFGEHDLEKNCPVSNWLNEREQEALNKLSADNEMSEKAVLRQALRLYQLADSYLKKGYELAFHHPKEGYVRPLDAGPKKAPYSPLDSEASKVISILLERHKVIDLHKDSDRDDLRRIIQWALDQKGKNEPVA